MKLVEAAVMEVDIPIALHLTMVKTLKYVICIDGGFTSVMIDGSRLSFEEILN